MLSESPGTSERGEQSGENSASGPVDPRLAMLSDAPVKSTVKADVKPSATVQLRTLDKSADHDEESEPEDRRPEQDAPDDTTGADDGTSDATTDDDADVDATDESDGTGEADSEGSAEPEAAYEPSDVEEGEEGEDAAADAVDGAEADGEEPGEASSGEGPEEEPEAEAEASEDGSEDAAGSGEAAGGDADAEPEDEPRDAVPDEAAPVAVKKEEPKPAPETKPEAKAEPAAEPAPKATPEPKKIADPRVPSAPAAPAASSSTMPLRKPEKAPETPAPAAPAAASAPESAAPESAAPESAAPPKPAPSKAVPPKPAGPPPAAPPVPPLPAAAPPMPKAAPVPAPERTKQQPLPPEPDDPLKLLAALTNTPPPPETPLRTAVRRIKIWTPLALLLIIVLGAVQMLRPVPKPSLDMTAASSYSFKGSKPQMPWPVKGQAALSVGGLGSLGRNGDTKPQPIASVTKVMTAYLILRDHPLKKGQKGPEITVDAKAQTDYEKGLPENESVVKVEEGQKITEYEALQDLMIPSANNVARLLGRWDAGSEKAFAEKMNKAAEELGMKNTEYTDPSGLDATTVSTAEDQVKLGEVAMKNPVFREIVNTGVYRPQLYTDNVYNHNLILHQNGVVGVKTGNSTAGGANFLFAAEKKVGGTTQLIIGAVLGQRGSVPGRTAANAARDLVVAAQDVLTSVKVIKKGDVVGSADDGLGTKVPVIATKDVVAAGYPGLTVKIDLKAGKDGLPRKAAAGEQVGTLNIGDGPGRVKVPVKLESATKEPSFADRLFRLL